MTTQYYEISLLLPANGSITSTTTTINNANYPSVAIPRGTLKAIYVTVPVGANQAVYFKLLLNGIPIFPNNSQTGYSQLTNSVAVRLSLEIPIFGQGGTLDIIGFNTSTTNQYLITILAEVEV